MKALILNSGIGSRMGCMTSDHPKCMTEIAPGETILSRQLKQLLEFGISDVIITTGYKEDVLIEYCTNLKLNLNIVYVYNSKYLDTNYIYSIYCAREYLDDDIIVIHGDLVFENAVAAKVFYSPCSCMAVSSSVPLPDKDFKAVIENGKIVRIGIKFFDNSVAAQPLYKYFKNDFLLWMNKIIEYCENGKVTVYAEEAFNEISDECNLFPMDCKKLICSEIDTPNDFQNMFSVLSNNSSRIVYMCFSTDIIHGGHISIIKKAQKIGKVIIGVLSDEAVASYKRFPLVPASERMIMFENITGVYKVIEQTKLSYKEVLDIYHPDIVVHGDDWCEGIQRPIREEVIDVLDSYGGMLVEFPYSDDEIYKTIQSRTRSDLAMPDMRRSRLRKLLNIKGFVTAMEAHDGLSGLIVENTIIPENGGAHQFDAMWISSLCDSTSKGKPDIELVDMTSRFRTIEDITEVTTKPIIFDGDTGGKTEHFVYNVRSLERLGVSMVIIEDKTGLKKNSLFGTEVEQTQDSIENFCDKIRAGKKAQRTSEFMICARIESLILEKGMDDALTRAMAYVESGADAIMIHSRKKDPSEIQEFIERFRNRDKSTPIVLVPTSFNSVTEEEWKQLGANIIIYANQLMRAEVPAMTKAAETILNHHRAEECDSFLMPFNEIIRLISTDV